MALTTPCGGGVADNKLLRKHRVGLGSRRRRGCAAGICRNERVMWRQKGHGPIVWMSLPALAPVCGRIDPHDPAYSGLPAEQQSEASNSGAGMIPDEEIDDLTETVDEAICLAS